MSQLDKRFAVRKQTAAGNGRKKKAA